MNPRLLIKYYLLDNNLLIKKYLKDEYNFYFKKLYSSF